MIAFARMSLTYLWVVLILSATGCAALDRAKLADRARTDLVGITRGDLLACAGAPDKRLASGDREYFTYVVQTVKGTGAAVRSRFCEATFVLKDGRVEAITYRGKTGGLLSKGEQCGYIVENCLN